MGSPFPMNLQDEIHQKYRSDYEAQNKESRPGMVRQGTCEAKVPLLKKH